MTEINAFKCDYCGKVYTTSKTCKAHEKNCYYNPTTRSCASCKQLELEKKYLSPGEYTKIQVCKEGVDIQNEGLQSRCSLHVEKVNRDDEEISSSDHDNNRADSSWEAFLNSSLRVLSESELI